MKKILATASAIGIGAGMALAGGGVANAAQGGITPDSYPVSHTWVKVGRAELDQRGAQAACLSSGLGYWGCDGLVSELNTQRSRYPKANGYWAEKYYNVKNPGTIIKLRSGTW
jgi:hypothetical protein